MSRRTCVKWDLSTLELDVNVRTACGSGRFLLKYLKKVDFRHLIGS